MPLLTTRVTDLRDSDMAAIVAIGDECRLSPWSLKDYLDEAKRRDSIMLKIMTDDGRLAGFVVGRVVPGSMSDGGSDAELYNIGVRKALQSMGIGAVLISSFLERCQRAQVQAVWLDARISNHRAIRFYKRFGFVETAVRKGFYTDPVEDSTVMRASLI